MFVSLASDCIVIVFLNVVLTKLTNKKDNEQDLRIVVDEKRMNYAYPIRQHQEIGRIRKGVSYRVQYVITMKQSSNSNDHDNLFQCDVFVF